MASTLSYVLFLIPPVPSECPITELLTSLNSAQKTHDDDDFIRQLRRAIEPHERHIPPWMTHEAVEERIEKWIQTNWTEKALGMGNQWRKWDGGNYDHVVL